MKKKRKKKCDDWEKVKGTPPKNSACYAHQYMTINCIDTEGCFTLDVEHLLPLANAVTIAEKPIVSAKEKLPCRFGRVFDDGGFNGIEMIKMFIRNKTHYVVRASKNDRVKSEITKCQGLWYRIVW